LKRRRSLLANFPTLPRFPSPYIDKRIEDARAKIYAEVVVFSERIFKGSAWTENLRSPVFRFTSD